MIVRSVFRLATCSRIVIYKVINYLKISVCSHFYVIVLGSVIF